MPRLFCRQMYHCLISRNTEAMADDTTTDGWMFRVKTPNSDLPPRYFVVGHPLQKPAWQLIEKRADVGGDHIEVVGRVAAPNVMSFNLRQGEVKQIDAP
jgi:hypothetical protein